MTRYGGSARFTPSLLGADELEVLFVHREPLVADAIDRIERAAGSRERPSRLFVGPRGAGKTHLLSLVYHRAKKLDGFASRFQLAWLPEDLWTIGGFDDLAEQILDRLEPFVDRHTDDRMPERLLVDLAAERGPIVVLVENLDHVLRDLGPAGQRRLRAVLEGERSLLLIATTTKVGRDLKDQTSPFYGFFDEVELERFDVDQATEMLQRIAHLNGDEELVEALASPKGRARLSAVAHLAGGQPRIWALFGSGLTVEGLDDLVGVLLRQFDDLTPYYQERLARLSVNERKVVATLIRNDRSMNVKEIAEASGIEQRSLSKTIKELRESGWLRARTGLLASMTDQRLTYYDLDEPLARLAFQLKESRGKPVQLVVDFLKAWFDHELPRGEVRTGTSMYLEATAALTQVDRLVRLLLDPTGAAEAETMSEETHEGLLRLDLALQALDRGDPGPLLSEPAAVTSVFEDRMMTQTIAEERATLAAAAMSFGRPEDWAERLEELVAQSAPDHHAFVLVVACIVNEVAGRHDVALWLFGLLEQVALDARERGFDVRELEDLLRPRIAALLHI